MDDDSDVLVNDHTDADRREAKKVKVGDPKMAIAERIYATVGLAHPDTAGQIVYRMMQDSLDELQSLASDLAKQQKACEAIAAELTRNDSEAEPAQVFRLASAASIIV